MENRIKLFLSIFLISFSIFSSNAQVAINTTGNSPDPSAMLDVVSDSKGLLIPRLLTSQRTTLASTAVDGLLVFDSEEQSFYLFSNSAWIDLSSSANIWTQNAGIVYLSDNTKNVGIGTNAPTLKLDVRGINTDDEGVISLSNSDQSHMLRIAGGRDTYPDPYIQWKDGDNLRFVTDQSGWSEKMRITSGGNVGIGTNAPASNTRLHVLQTGTGLASQFLGTVASFQTNFGTNYWSRVSIIGGNEGASVLDLGDADNQQAGRISYEHTDNFMAFQTDDTEKMRISSSGNVGIGSSSPLSKFHVSGGNIRLDNSDFLTELNISNSSTNQWSRPMIRLHHDALSADNQDIQIMLENITDGGGGDGTFIIRNWQDASQTYNDILKYEMTDQNLSFSSSNFDLQGGLLSLASENFSALSLTASGTNGREYRITSTDDLNGLGGGKMAFYDETAGAPRMVINSSGNIGIGNISPSWKLDVGGDVNFTGDLYQNGSPFALSEAGGWTDDGTIVRLTNPTDFVGIGTSTPLYKLHINDITTERALYAFSQPVSGNAYSVYGEAAGTGSPSYGFYGLAHGDNFNYGVSGEAYGGTGSSFGVRGYAHGTGLNFAVSGIASGGTTNWAGFFFGDTKITEDLYMMHDKWIGIGDADVRVVFDDVNNQFEIMDAVVGIGTSSPTANLDIAGSGTPVLNLSTTEGAGADAVLRINGARTTSLTNDVSQIEFYNVESGGEFQMAEISSRNADDLTGTSPSDLLFQVNNGTDLIEAMRIDDIGNVGIGTNSPLAPLHVVTNSSGYAIHIEETGLGTEDWQIGVDGTGHLKFFDGTNDRVTIFDGGSVYIEEEVGIGGYNYPWHKLHVHHFTSGDFDLYGIYSEAESWSLRPAYGVYGLARGVQENNSIRYGVYGEGTAYSGYYMHVYGVYGEVNENGGTGSRIAVYGRGISSSSNYGGYFYGNLHSTGTSTKASGAIKIDHPLDPENKYLYHSSVESSDMMNIYNGNVILNTKGMATVKMPDWFEAINMEFRYQLTAIGAPGPNLYIKEKITDNQFVIAGGTAGMEVSWQITGIRNDPFASEHRIKIEEDKPDREKGTYLHPDLYGQPIEKGIDFKVEKGE